ncbi:MAG: pitrilysin family protein [Deltaproteobacteria bacterium]
MKQTPRWVWAALLAVTACKTTQTNGGGGEDADITIPHEKYTLDNGLEVILHQDNRLPLVAVSIWYHVGAIDEVKGRSGFAHLFEHMMFQASPHVGEDQFFKILEQIGGTSINGTTNYDRTNYFETVPSHELETVLWMESDRMGFLLSSLTKKALDVQIGVVQNERRQSVENREYGLMNEALTKALYPEPHPYNGVVIGSMEDIAAATLDDIRDFFRTYYTPANATLTIAGDFETAEAKALVTKYFGSLKGKAKPPRRDIPAPPVKAQRIEFEEPVAKLPKISIAWRGPSSFEDDTAALDLLSHVISGTRSSRLDKRVSHDEQIAQSVTAYFSEHASGGVFEIDLVTRPDRTLAEAEAAIEEVLADLVKNPPTADELKRAKNSQLTQIVRGLEQLGGFGGRAERLQVYNHYLGDPARVAWDLERFAKVTVADLVRVQKKYLTDQRITILATPKGATE